MNRLLIIAIVGLVFSSCKSHYTGFNAYKADANSIKPKVEILDLNKNVKPIAAETNSFEASIAPKFTPVNIEEGLKKIALSENKITIKALNNKEVSKKLSLKEKIVNKLVAKQIKKSNMATNSADGFSGLDSKLKIGIILIAVAIGLSILGLGQLAGLAGLIGLIFLIFGLVNTYN